MGKSHELDVSDFSSSLHLKDLIDWIDEIVDYFDIEEIKNPERVRLAHAKLKGHVSLWWNEL